MTLIKHVDGKNIPMTPNEEILWMGYFIEDLQTHRIVVVPDAASEVRDE